MGDDGYARIAGLGSTKFIPTSAPTGNKNGPFRRASASAGFTAANDVFWFGLVAWEVSLKLVAPSNRPLNGTGFVTGVQWEASILEQECRRRGVFATECHSTGSTRQSRTFSWRAEGDPEVFEKRAIETHDSPQNYCCSRGRRKFS